MSIVPSGLEPSVDERESIRRRVTAGELVAVVEQAERDIREAFARIEAARGRVREAVGYDDHGILVRDRWGRVDFSEPDGCLIEVRRQVWRQLADLLELPRIMSVRAWEELERQLDNGTPPPIDEANVGAMLRRLHQQLPAMAEEAIREVFDFLRPRRREFKTNDRFEIGRKVILQWVTERDDVRWPRANPRVNYSARQKLNALERVFLHLDGRGSTLPTHQSALQTAVESTPWGQRAETEFFRAKSYRAGTLHLEFKRPDLVKKLNAIAGGKNLKEAEKAKGESSDDAGTENP